MTDFPAAARQPQSRAERRAMLEAGEQRPSAQEESMRHARRPSKTGRKVTLWALSSFVVLGLAAVGWVGYQALTAKNSLEAAKTLIGTVKDQAGAADFAGIAQSAELLSEHTGSAVAAAHDPVWRAGEAVPILGKNLTAVREMAEVVDSIAQETVAPLATVAGGLSPESLKPVDGRINIDPIVQLSVAFGPAAEAFHAAVERGATIDVDGTVGPVQEAGAELSGMLAQADDLIGGAASVVQIAPELLGANGPRTYVLMFQNLAEATALGGSSAALTEINVDNGAISIGRQASSGDFPWRDMEGKGGPIIAPEPAVEDIFGPLMYTRLNLAPSRPDFPTAAGIAKEFWQQHMGGDVDAVISIDPVALAHILRATGPIPMSTGDQLSSDNAVRLLLNEVYFRYQGDEIPLSDAFFAEAAKSVFDALMSPGTDMPQLIAAVAQSIGEQRVLAWSPLPEVQTALASTPLSGILPTDNASQSTTGVFFRDMSASKMDYYLETAATLDSDACTVEAPTFTTTVDLHSNITPELAAQLPAYVASAPWGGDKFRTQVFVYGPPGSTLADATVVSQGVETTFDKSANDLGRPVAVFSVYLAPGESSQVVARFTAPAGTYGPAELRTTPMLIPTATQVTSPGCD